MGLKLNYKKTFLLGFGFLGVSLMWLVYNSYVPIFLQAGNPAFDRAAGCHHRRLWPQRRGGRLYHDPGQYCRLLHPADGRRSQRQDPHPHRPPHALYPGCHAGSRRRLCPHPRRRQPDPAGPLWPNGTTGRAIGLFHGRHRHLFAGHGHLSHPRHRPHARYYALTAALQGQRRHQPHGWRGRAVGHLWRRGPVQPEQVAPFWVGRS